MSSDCSHAPRVVALLGVACLLSCATTPREVPPPTAKAEAHHAELDPAATASALEAAGARDGVDPVAARQLGRLYRDRDTIQGRLLSQGVLESAHAHHPDDVEVTMELASTYFAQSFYPDALRLLRAVLATDPSRCDAHRLMGLYHYQNWKRMNEYTDDLGDARRELRTALTCDPGDADVALRALIAGYARGDSIRTECDDLVARFPAQPEFRMMRGTVAFETQHYDACARDYTAGIDLMDDATASVYRNLTDVLAANDDARYRSSTDDVREDFQRGLWLVADPDPTTDVNPRALEHTYRLFVADCLYSNEPTDKRGWETDRGEAFVRFGRPMDIDYTMGDVFASGKVETWSFNTNGLFHQLVFVDEFLNGNPRIPYEADITLHFMRHSPAATTLVPDATPIPGFVDAYAFRDEAMAGSIYLAMAVDADALRSVVDLSQVNRFHVRAAYFDATWEREGGFADTVSASGVIETRSTRGRAFEVVRRVQVPCDRYHFAMAFEDQFAIARAVGRRDADARRFLGDELALSDVLLYRAEAPQPGEAAIERGGARMRPNVERQCMQGERLRAYVEIYNLALTTQGSERVSSYDLRYAIFPAPSDTDPAWVDWGRRAIEWAGFGDDEDADIAQTFRREGRTHDDRESIAIDVDALDDGRYELVVEVTDRKSGQRALVHAPFWKEAGPVAERKK
jgi:GWxTD domain-containing protein